jgi:hypothetical protein
MTQQHRDPAPVAGVHLVKTTSREEDSLASDVVDLLREGTRGGTDTDVGGVEETLITTQQADELARTEQEFLQALAGRIKEVCPWVDGKRGLAVRELGAIGGHGWAFSVYDRDGRPFDVQLTYSEIREVALVQRRATVSNFRRVLDNVCEKLTLARAGYFARRDAAEVH